jgi:hypothetical protein
MVKIQVLLLHYCCYVAAVQSVLRLNDAIDTRLKTEELVKKQVCSTAVLLLLYSCTRLTDAI